MTESLNYSAFEKAIVQLEKSLAFLDSDMSRNSPDLHDQFRSAVIQTFEYTMELAWKMLKRYLEMFGLEKVDGLSNKDLFRVGHEQGMIQNPEHWFEYLKSRNLTSHTYQESTAEQVNEVARRFVPDAKYFLDRLKEKVS